MGFWSELFNASPSKGIARAEELKFKVVTHVIPVPPGLEDRAKICSLCRIHIGDKFTRNLLPYLVVTEDSNLTFDSSTTGVVVCSNCIDGFDIRETITNNDNLERFVRKKEDKKSKEYTKNREGAYVDGNWTTWYKNGQVRSEEKGSHPQLSDGTKTEWYKNGQVKEEINYKDGEYHGKWTVWYENGQTKSESNYKNGKVDGKNTDWYKNGQIEREINYKDDKFHGKWTWWGENGQIIKERTYKNGELETRLNKKLQRALDNLDGDSTGSPSPIVGIDGLPIKKD